MLRYYHVVGQKQEQDVLVYEMPDHPQWMAGAEVTDDGKYIILTISEGCDPVNRLYYVPFDAAAGIPKPVDFIKVVDNFDAQYDYIANDGPVFTFKTNLGAPKYKLIRADISVDADKLSWTDVVAESENVLEWWVDVPGPSERTRHAHVEG